MIPAVREDGRMRLIFRVDIPEQESVDHGTVLNAVVFRPAVGQTPDVELLTVLRVALAKANAGYVLGQGLDVEVDGSVAKGEIVEGKISCFQNDDSVGETFLCHVVHVGLIADRTPVC